MNKVDCLIKNMKDSESTELFDCCDCPLRDCCDKYRVMNDESTIGVES